MKIAAVLFASVLTLSLVASERVNVDKLTVKTLPEAVYANLKKGKKLSLTWKDTSFAPARGFKIGEVKWKAEARNGEVSGYISFRWLSMAAERGVSGAQYHLGECYRLGTGVEVDLAEWFSWTEKAAAADIREAAFDLGRAYEGGTLVPRDDQKAAHWYQKASAARWGVAETSRFLESPEVKIAVAMDKVNRDRVAADAGGLGALERLVCHLIEENPPDFPQAIALLRHGAMAWSPYCMLVLGCMLLGFVACGDEPLDEEGGFQWLLKAAHRGDVRAAFRLGECYRYGLGVTVNWPAFYFWTEKAAGKGNTNALFNLGRAYQFGEAVAPDPAKAAKYYQRASDADSPHSNATYNLGYLYYKGLGVRRDLSLAIALWEKAAGLGDEAAKKALASRTLKKAIARDKPGLWS